MGLNTYCCLIFLWVHLIHLTDLLSQVVQIMCVMHDIYIISEKSSLSLSFHLSVSSSLIGEGTRNTFELNLGCRKGSHIITDWALSWRQWSKKMAYQGERFVNFCFMHALISTCDPMLFKYSSIGIIAKYGWHLSCIFGLF